MGYGKIEFHLEHLRIGNCNIHGKQKILVLNEMKQDKFLLKLKV